MSKLSEQSIIAYIGLNSNSGSFAYQQEILKRKIPQLFGVELEDCKLFQDVMATKSYFGVMPHGRKELIDNLEKDIFVVVSSLSSLGGLEASILTALKIEQTGANLIVLDLDFNIISNLEKIEILKLLHASLVLHKVSSGKAKKKAGLDSSFVKNVVELIEKYNSVEKVSTLLRVSSDQVVNAISQHDELNTPEELEEVPKKKKKSKK